MKLYILDVSGFLFRAYFALPPMTNPQGEATGALFGLIRSLLKLLKTYHPTHLVAVYDGPKNKESRRALYADYKANRTEKQEDLIEQIARSKKFFNLMGITHLEGEGIEADDMIGTLATHAAAQGIEVAICTADKDLCQLVNTKIHLLNPWKEYQCLDPEGVEATFGVKPTQIADYLGLVGDTSDNIPGIAGFGPKTAVSLLQTFGSLDNLLAHIDQVEGAKKQERLRAEGETALLSRTLATLQIDPYFPLPKEVFPILTCDEEGLRTFYHQQGFYSLLKEQERGPQQAIPMHLIDEEAALHTLIEKLRQHSAVAFDCETTSLSPMEALPVGIGFCAGKSAYYVPFNGALGTKALEILTPFLETHPLFGHHVKYDCHVLANCGLLVKNIIFDTILASYLLNASSRSHALDSLALELFGIVMTPISVLIGTGKKEITMDQVPIEKVCAYCCEDAFMTWKLRERFSKDVEKRGLSSLLYDLELPLSQVLLKMERTGVYIDVNALKVLGTTIAEQLHQVEKEIFDLAGESFNINSPKQLATILFEKMGISPLKKTTTGYSTNADVLETLSTTEPIASKVLSYRSLEKLRSTYIETLPQQVNARTGRIHPTFTQYVAATGRLACQEPNLQNIPVRTALGKQIRSAFMPQKEGWSYLSADYSQIELRLLAHLSGDPALLTAFQEGSDVHTYTAQLMFDKKEVSSEERRQAKAINFGILYGQQAYGLARELHIDISRAAAFIEAYYHRYPQVFNYLQASIELARKTGKAVTMAGRQRLIPDINNSNAQIRAAAERLAVNTPLQGSQADLIKKAMLLIDAEISQRRLQSLMILQIHDALIFEVPDTELPLLRSLVKEIMEGAMELKVPLVVDVSVGKNWGEC